MHSEPMKKIIHFLLCCLAVSTVWAADTKQPVRFAIFGLVHDHAMRFLPRALEQPDGKLVGIIEPDQNLVARYQDHFHLKTNLFYGSLEELLAKKNIQAVAPFPSSVDHRRVVELCAPR